jgi:glycosyltransferase involved in cell wall biosynthesis
VITDLGIGGAEIMLVQLVERWQREGHANHVVSLLSRGRLVGRLRAAGADVTELTLRRGSLPGLAAWQLRHVYRTFRPDVSQGWMYHGNLAAQFGRFLAGDRSPLFWSIHFTLPVAAALPLMTRLVIRAGAFSSSRTAGIIYCSSVSADQHGKLGYAASKRLVISNGIDSDRYLPDAAARARLVERLGLPRDRAVLGLFARFDPMKNHVGLLRALAGLRAEGFSLHLLLAGSGISPDNATLQAAVETLGLKDNVTMLGEREDVEDWMPGLDIFVLPSSYGEAFPLVLGEAMAAGVPVVATDVGDCGRIVGDAGSLIAVDKPEDLTTAIANLLTIEPLERKRLAAAARQRVIENFSLSAISDRYMSAYNAALLPLARVSGHTMELPQCAE